MKQKGKPYSSYLRDEKARILAERTEKWCNRCKRVLPLDKFYQPSKSGLTKTSAWCQKCVCEYARERRVEIRREREAIMRKRN